MPILKIKDCKSTTSDFKKLEKLTQNSSKEGIIKITAKLNETEK